MLKYHIIAFAAGFILDLIIGDPYYFPHPVKIIGRLISVLENAFIGEKEISQKMETTCCNSAEYKNNITEDNDSKKNEDSSPKEDNLNKRNESRRKRIFGFLTVGTVVILSMSVTAVILFISYGINKIAGCVVEAIMTYQILAMKCLKTESMKVYDKLKSGNINDSRLAVSMIVGRDTENLNEEGIIKATVETIAENTSDGVIAPMLFSALGGPVLGIFYKAVNTCDSMIGYKNERYMDFGRFGARLDDVLNFLPSRISAVLMIICCLFLGHDYDFKRAVYIFKRDRFNHKSPNSAQTESTLAGALGLKLAGDASYFNKIVKKPYIGDEIRKIEINDIKRANRLLYATSFLCEILLIFIMSLVYWS